MAKDYKISEGNMIGYLSAEFGTDLSLNQKKLTAGADLTKGQVVYISDDMTVSPTADASKAVLGVAVFDAKSGEAAFVETEGLFALTASGTIAAGSQVESAADGKVATVGGTATKVIGIALNDATDGNEVFVKFSI